MHASRTDFYVTPIRDRVPLQSWPRDFTPSWIEFYAAKPLDPAVEECQHCTQLRSCRPGAYARPECREQEHGAAQTPALPPAKPVKRGRPADQNRAQEMTLAALAEQPHTITELESILSLNYLQVRRVVQTLLAAGAVRQAGWKHTGIDTGYGFAKLYELGAAVHTHTREPGETHVNAVLAALQAATQPQTRQMLARALGMTPEQVRSALRCLVRYGEVSEIVGRWGSERRAYTASH